MAYEQPCASYMLRQTPAAAIFAADLLYMLHSLRLSSSPPPFTTSPAFLFLITFISNHIKLKITLIDGIITHPLPCSSYVRWRKWVEGEAARLKLHEISMKFFL